MIWLPVSVFFTNYTFLGYKIDGRNVTFDIDTIEEQFKMTVDVPENAQGQYVVKLHGLKQLKLQMDGSTSFESVLAQVLDKLDQQRNEFIDKVNFFRYNCNNI